MAKAAAEATGGGVTRRNGVITIRCGRCGCGGRHYPSRDDPEPRIADVFPGWRIVQGKPAKTLCFTCTTKEWTPPQ